MISNSTPGWLELHELSFHKQSEAVSPQGLYVEGYMEIENNFIPTTGIKGTAFAETPSKDTTPGWVEFSGLRFISDVTAVQPAEPYVKGLQDEEGKFYPDKPYNVVGSLRA